MEREYDSNMQAVREILPSTIQKRSETLQMLQRALMEPAKVGHVQSVRGQERGGGVDAVP